MMELILFIAIIDYIEKNYYEFYTFTLGDFKQILLNYISTLMTAEKIIPPSSTDSGNSLNTETWTGIKSPEVVNNSIKDDALINSSKTEQALLIAKNTNLLPEDTPPPHTELMIIPNSNNNYKTEIINTESSLNKTSDVIKKNFRGTILSVLINKLGIITGEVIFNIEGILALKLKNNIIVFINNNAISGFY